ncbi:MAG TPA: glycosyltransferase, partial [Bdellovibrionales bacterium]|nr:glycosyltransferase [Bdellovibrionales bacterium]
MISPPARTVLWSSMREILPAIESAWRPFNPKVVYPASAAAFFEALPALLTAKRIVVTFLNAHSVTAMRVLRQEYGSRVPFVIYLHGDGTNGAQALTELNGLLTKQDQFISSCSADARALRLCLHGAKVHVIPFPLGAKARKPRVVANPPLVYVGRVSEQKNLHTLIWSLWVLKAVFKRPMRLSIYGREDGYGSPNMNLHTPNLGRRLKALAKRLGVEALIEWRGHCESATLEREVYSKHHVFVSASLHADENFGLAAFRSLCSGNPAALTRWGAHTDLYRKFRGRVRLARVYRGSHGPFVSPLEL